MAATARCPSCMWRETNSPDPMAEMVETEAMSYLKALSTRYFKIKKYFYFKSIWTVDKNLKSLNKIRTLIKARSGEEGMSYHMKGKSAEHLVVKVPAGTTFKDQNQNLVNDLNADNTQFIAARGWTLCHNIKLFRKYINSKLPILKRGRR